MISGRKLLLADDSAAVQKVIELTFADEGMEVFSVGDGQTAWEKLEYFTPDVVLADAFMPGLSGYELCRSIKDDNRFAQIPVMLLVSSFAPFDEAEAQRVGADDIMTKPFQSIRQLVSRVDSLLSGQRPMAAPVPAPEPALPQLNPDDVVLAPVEVDHSEPHVTVLVEAAQLEAAAAPEPAGACAPDLEFQTADTARLEPSHEQSVAAVDEDTIEIEPRFDEAGMDLRSSQDSPADEPNVFKEPGMTQVTPHEPTQPRFSESLLDLDESSFVASPIADDEVVLDLDESPVAVHEDASWEVAPAEEPAPVPAAAMFVHEPELAEANVPEPSPVMAETVMAETVADEPASPVEASTAALPQALAPNELSADMIDAIARRVIEQMSDKVVREIAWEVVPELSEMMIRKKLEQQ